MCVNNKIFSPPYIRAPLFPQSIIISKCALYDILESILLTPR